jgi:hypothetical protein
MKQFIPINKKTKQEYPAIDATDKKDAALKWNTVFEGFAGKYDFKEVVNVVPKPERAVNIPVKKEEN